MRWAMRKGLWFGMHETPVPNLICRVMGNAEAMIRSGAGMFSHSAVKCSPIHASLYPSSSSLTSCSMSSSTVCAKSLPGGCSGMVKKPSSNGAPPIVRPFLYSACLRFEGPAGYSTPPAARRMSGAIFGIQPLRCLLFASDCVRERVCVPVRESVFFDHVHG